MFDGIKIQIMGISMPELSKNPNFEFSAPVRLDTGELKYNYHAKYRNLDLVVKSEKYFTLQGSLHKFWNNGINSSDFTYNEFCAAVAQICKDISVSPSQLRILRIEFGVNIMLDCSPSNLLDRLLCYGYKPFSVMDNGIGKQCVLAQYSLKIYSKLLQGVTEENILRVEYKVTKMQNLPQMRTVNDLLDLDTWDMLGGKLIHSLNRVLWYDFSVSHEQFQGVVRDFIIEAKNPHYWERLSRRRALDSKRRLLGIFANSGAENYFITLVQLVQSKLNQLRKTDIFTSSSKSGDSVENGHFYSLDKGELSNRYCKSCGRDISNQRSNSKFCSESKYGIQGKVCRNKASNPINNRKRKISKILRMGVLFDIEPYFIYNNP